MRNQTLNKTLNKILELQRVIDSQWNIHNVDDVDITQPSITLYLSSTVEVFSLGKMFGAQIIDIINVMNKLNISTKDASSCLASEVDKYSKHQDVNKIMVAGFIYLFRTNTGHEAMRLLNTNVSANISAFVIIKQVRIKDYIMRPFLTLDSDVLSPEKAYERVKQVIEYDILRNKDYYS